MYELLSKNRGDLIPLHFPGEGGSLTQFKYKDSSCYEMVVFIALFCGVVDCVWLIFLFYVSSLGCPHLTNLRSNDTKSFLLIGYVKVHNFPTPALGYKSSALNKFSL